MWIQFRSENYPVSADADFLATQGGYAGASTLTLPHGVVEAGVIRASDVMLVALARDAPRALVTVATCAVTILEIVSTAEGAVLVATGLASINVTSTPIKCVLPGKGDYVLRITNAPTPGAATTLELYYKVI